VATDSTLPASIKRGYAVATVIVGLLSLAVCGGIAAGLGADGQSMILSLAGLTIGIAIALAPVIIDVKSHSFGMAVVAASGARMLVALAVVMIGTMALDLPRKPIGLGVGAGLLLALVAETILAMSVVSRVNRKTELA